MFDVPSRRPIPPEYSWETNVVATGGKMGLYGITPIVHAAGANEAAVTLGNTDGEIGGLTISELERISAVSRAHPDVLEIRWHRRETVHRAVQVRPLPCLNATYRSA